MIKPYVVPAFYHVYNRASGERKLFRDSADRNYFVSLLEKYLAESEPPEDESNREIIKRYDVEIVAYCLMGTHFHLLVYQELDSSAIIGYMRAISTAYSMYYNKKYKSKGHVFQSSYRASHITTDSYLAHISRYIHLNPAHRYATWEWSSYREYVSERDTGWIHPERALGEYQTGEAYRKFVADYSPTDRRVQYAELSGLGLLAL